MSDIDTGLAQSYGECITDKEYMEFIEKEINIESTTQQVIELLIKNYAQKTEHKYSLFPELGEFNEKQSI